MKKVVLFLFVFLECEGQNSFASSVEQIFLQGTVISNVIRFLDEDSIGKLSCVSKSFNKKIMDQAQILKSDEVGIFKKLIDNPQKKELFDTKEGRKNYVSHGGTDFFIHELENESVKNKNFKSFLNNLFRICCGDASRLELFQLKWAHKNLLDPFFIKVFEKKENETWGTIFTKNFSDGRGFVYPSFLLVYNFFLENGLSGNHLFGCCLNFEYLLGCGVFNSEIYLRVFQLLVKQRAKLNDVSIGLPLELAVKRYLCAQQLKKEEIWAKDDLCDWHYSAVEFFLTNGADMNLKPHKSNETILQTVEKSQDSPLINLFEKFKDRY